MEEYTQITLDEWMQWKEDIRRKLAETAENFVHIGYRLRQIRDSGMYDGAADVFEFAQKEYGLGKSTVSRFIAINEKYSEGGYSLELREEYRGFSSSKLSEMLTLPDAELELITEKTTIKEIRELKEFDRQQPEEIMVEAPEENAEPVSGEEAAAVIAVPEEWVPLDKCIIDFFGAKKEVLNDILRILREEEPDYREAMERMNPSGQCSHKKGLIFLFMYDWITGIKYKKLSEPEPVSMSWPDFLGRVAQIYSGCTGEDAWKEFYGIAEEPVATSQQPEKAEQEPAAESKSTTAAVVEEAEQIPGQTSLEEDFPEYMPEEKTDTDGKMSEDAEKAEQSAAGAEEPEVSVEQEPENGINTRCEGLLEYVKSHINIWNELQKKADSTAAGFKTMHPKWAKSDEEMQSYLEQLHERALDVAADIELLLYYRNGGEE